MDAPDRLSQTSSPSPQIEHSESVTSLLYNTAPPTSTRDNVDGGSSVHTLRRVDEPDSHARVAADAELFSLARTESSAFSTVYGLGSTAGHGLMVMGEWIVRRVDEVTMLARVRSAISFLQSYNEEWLDNRTQRKARTQRVGVLLEHQRIGVYTKRVRAAAWNGIMKILDSDQYSLLSDAMVHMPDIEVQFFLRQLTLCRLSDWTWDPVRGYLASAAGRRAVSESVTKRYTDLIMHMIGNRLSVLSQVLSLEELLACCTSGRSHIESLSPFDEQHHAAILEQSLESMDNWQKLSITHRSYSEETILELPRDSLQCSRKLTYLALLVCHEPGSWFTKYFVDYAMGQLVLPSPYHNPTEGCQSPYHLTHAYPIQDFPVPHFPIQEYPIQRYPTQEYRAGRQYWLIAWLVAVLCYNSDQMASQFGDAGIVNLAQAQLSLLDCHHISGSGRYQYLCPCFVYRVILRLFGQYHSSLFSSSLGSDNGLVICSAHHSEVAASTESLGPTTEYKFSYFRPASVVSPS